jgi:hypothetical protein
LIGATGKIRIPLTEIAHRFRSVLPVSRKVVEHEDQLAETYWHVDSVRRLLVISDVCTIHGPFAQSVGVQQWMGSCDRSKLTQIELAEVIITHYQREVSNCRVCELVIPAKASRAQLVTECACDWEGVTPFLPARSLYVYRNVVVEAAGVEPASENVTGQETTCLFRFMPWALPQDVRVTGSERTRNRCR